jgi:hypothetical protein
VANILSRLSCNRCAEEKRIKDLKEEAGCFDFIRNVHKDKYFKKMQGATWD